MPPINTVDRVMQRAQKLDAMKQPWLNLYTLISEFVMMRIDNFSSDNFFSPQQFVPDRVFDSTAKTANSQMASSLIGALWPSIDKTFVLAPPKSMERSESLGAEIKEWYECATHIMRGYIANPEAAFQAALDPYMKDQGAYGTSGIGVFDNYDNDKECPLKFKPIDIKHASIAEGADGFVDTVYNYERYTVRQLVQEFGLERCSKETQEKFRNQQNLDDNVKVLRAVEPRLDGVQGSGNQSYPVAQILIEVDAKHIIAESGFHEMPIFVTRFDKIMDNTPYGHSPAISVLPDIFEVNNVKEAAIIAIEKYLDPPLLVDPNQMVNNGTIDTSAGALNAMKLSGRADSRHKPVEMMVTVGELQYTYKRILEIQQVIKDGFYNDDMRDLNNETRMTLGEANIRDRLRGQALVSVYTRQMNELFTRMLQRIFNILLLHGLLGMVEGSQEYQEFINNPANEGIKPFIIPKTVLQLMTAGKDCYRIDFISPAARIMRTDELMGVQQTISAVSGMAATNPTVVDVIDWDETVRVIVELTGAPSQVLKSSEAIAQLRKMKSDSQAQMADAEGKLQSAHTLKTAAQGADAVGKAIKNGVPLELFNGILGQGAA